MNAKSNIFQDHINAMEIAKKEGCEATEELERLTPLFSDRAKLVGRPRSCDISLCPLSLISTIYIFELIINQ